MTPLTSEPTTAALATLLSTFAWFICSHSIAKAYHQPKKDNMCHWGRIISTEFLFTQSAAAVIFPVI